VGTELWSSELVPARDTVGNFAKFSPPSVANGKVYLATFSNRVNVYGLLPNLHTASSGTNVVLTWNAGTLQQAASVSGPFSDLLSATSPYTITPSQPAQFFRVKPH
jgi:hypothetical protein